MKKWVSWFVSFVYAFQFSYLDTNLLHLFVFLLFLPILITIFGLTIHSFGFLVSLMNLIHILTTLYVSDPSRFLGICFLPKSVLKLMILISLFSKIFLFILNMNSIWARVGEYYGNPYIFNSSPSAAYLS